MQEKIKLQERRLAELADVRSKYTEVEQQLSILQRQKQEFEDVSSRQLPQLRSKVESYKSQVVELVSRSSDLEATLAHKEKQLKDLQGQVEESKRLQKQQDLLMKQAPKFQGPSLSDAPVTTQPTKKSSLANLIQTTDPEGEKKAKAIQDGLHAELARTNSKLDVVEDELQTTAMLLQRAQKELGLVKVSLADTKVEFESVCSERDELKAAKFSLMTEIEAARGPSPVNLRVHRSMFTSSLTPHFAAKLHQESTDKSRWVEIATAAEAKLEESRVRVNELELKVRLQEMQSKLITSAFYKAQLQLLQEKVAAHTDLASAESEPTESDFQSSAEFSKLIDSSLWNAGLADATEELPQRPRPSQLARGEDRKLSVAATRTRALRPVDANAGPARETKPMQTKRLTLAQRALAPRPSMSAATPNQSSKTQSAYESAPKRQKLRE